MSAILSSVLKNTVGILVNRFRSQTAKSLHGGDITEEECRKLIVQGLDDIKSKLDSLSRSFLLSSISSLEEGLDSFYFCLDRLRRQETASDSEVESSTSTSQLNPAGSSGFYEVLFLSEQVKNLRISSDDLYQNAKESFKEARKQANLAFNNADLSIEDRVQATQVRIMARILEGLEDLDPAVSNCLLYLQQLYALGPIQKIFSVSSEGGVKAFFNKARRVENVETVCSMRYVLLDFARKYTKLPMALPIFNTPTPEQRLKEQGIDVPKIPCQFRFDEKVSSTPFPVVTSTGEIIAKVGYNNAVRIFNGVRRSKLLCDFPRDDNVEAVAVDQDDNVYVITSQRNSYVCRLMVFSALGDLCHQCTLNCRGGRFGYFCAAVTKGKMIVIVNELESFAYVFDSTGTIARSFHVLGDMLCLSNDDQIITAQYRTVYVYTEDGQLAEHFEIPEEYEYIESIAFHHVNEEIILETLTYKNSLVRYYLLFYSAVGKLKNSVFCGYEGWVRNMRITSHPKGPVALIDPSQGANYLAL
jgi:hypothetical protein